MTESLDLVYESIEHEHRYVSASTRRQLIGGAGATLGGLGLLGLPTLAGAQSGASNGAVNDPQTILNVAATAEVLATIVNTIGFQQVAFTDANAATTKTNIQAAAREELAHYDVLTSGAIGGKAITTSIWVPDKVFADETDFLNTVVVGDQIFINAYLIATTTFGQAGNGRLARVAAEFMGSEAVHRALARQSLGLLGNDRVFMKYDQAEEAPGPGTGMPGFTNVMSAVDQLKAAGFGFGAQGATPGKFYDFNQVRTTTPEGPAGLNTRAPDNAGPAQPKACPAPKSDRREEQREKREERRERRQHRG